MPAKPNISASPATRRLQTPRHPLPPSSLAAASSPPPRASDRLRLRLGASTPRLMAAGAPGPRFAAGDCLRHAGIGQRALPLLTEKEGKGIGLPLEAAP
ncbi:hypothetical protein BRADI_3g17326v3 [Brachypodium distachyon]|uniref:Uncharacterized protein n=1 Tax=Brachypodium distachyon TaxID=15368 RepID=A0A0Q3Q1D5_BRADI|nr:hypothetical protein BRADI_3g17326v3 [Brachypodium distachyon]